MHRLRAEPLAIRRIAEPLVHGHLQPAPARQCIVNGPDAAGAGPPLGACTALRRLWRACIQDATRAGVLGRNAQALRAAGQDCHKGSHRTGKRPPARHRLHAFQHPARGSSAQPSSHLCFARRRRAPASGLTGAGCGPEGAPGKRPDSLLPVRADGQQALHVAGQGRVQGGLLLHGARAARLARRRGDALRRLRTAPRRSVSTGERSDDVAVTCPGRPAPALHAGCAGAVALCASPAYPEGRTSQAGRPGWAGVQPVSEPCRQPGAHAARSTAARPGARPAVAAGEAGAARWRPPRPARRAGGARAW